MSRPTKYRDEFADMALKLCKPGLTDAEMGIVFDVDARTINRWKKQHPAFCQSIKRASWWQMCGGAEALYSIRQMMGALFRGLPDREPKKKRG